MPEMPPKPIYVLAGQDDFLRRSQRKRILQDLSGPADARPQVAEFDGSASPAEVFDELRTLPLLAGRRMVIVSDADRFVLAHVRQVLNYLSSPSRTGVLVLLTGAWPVKASSRRSAPQEQQGQETPPASPDAGDLSGKELQSLLDSLARRVAQVGQVIDCGPPGASALPGWIAQAAAARGKTIAPAAAAALLERVGNDLGRIDGEMEKLSLLVGPDREIAPEDVEAVVAPTAGPEIFALSNAISAGAAKEALKALEALLVRPGDEFMLLGLIAARLRWRLAGTDWKSPRRVSPGRTCVDFRRILQADVAMKSGADAKATLQWLVAVLCQ